MSRYAKAIAGLLGAVATWGVTASEDGRYADTEIWGLLLALATALSVYAVPNRPPAGHQSDPRMSEQGHWNDNYVIPVILLIILVILLMRVL